MNFFARVVTCVAISLVATAVIQTIQKKTGSNTRTTFYMF